MDINMVLGGQDSVLLANSPDQAVSRLKHPCDEQVNDTAVNTETSPPVSFSTPSSILSAVLNTWIS